MWCAVRTSRQKDAGMPGRLRLRRRMFWGLAALLHKSANWETRYDSQQIWEKKKNFTTA